MNSDPVRGPTISFCTLRNEEIFEILGKFENNVRCIFIWVLNSTRDQTIKTKKNWGFMLIDEIY